MNTPSRPLKYALVYPRNAEISSGLNLISLNLIDFIIYSEFICVFKYFLKFGSYQ